MDVVPHVMDLFGDTASSTRGACVCTFLVLKLWCILQTLTVEYSLVVRHETQDESGLLSATPVCTKRYQLEPPP